MLHRRFSVRFLREIKDTVRGRAAGDSREQKLVGSRRKISRCGGRPLWERQERKESLRIPPPDRLPSLLRPFFAEFLNNP